MKNENLSIGFSGFFAAKLRQAETEANESGEKQIVFMYANMQMSFLPESGFERQSEIDDLFVLATAYPQHDKPQYITFLRTFFQSSLLTVIDEATKTANRTGKIQYVYYDISGRVDRIPKVTFCDGEDSSMLPICSINPERIKLHFDAPQDSKQAPASDKIPAEIIAHCAKCNREHLVSDYRGFMSGAYNRSFCSESCKKSFNEIQVDYEATLPFATLSTAELIAAYMAADKIYMDKWKMNQTADFERELEKNIFDEIVRRGSGLIKLNFQPMATDAGGAVNSASENPKVTDYIHICETDNATLCGLAPGAFNLYLFLDFFADYKLNEGEQFCGACLSLALKIVSAKNLNDPELATESDAARAAMLDEIDYLLAGREALDKYPNAFDKISHLLKTVIKYERGAYQINPAAVPGMIDRFVFEMALETSGIDKNDVKATLRDFLLFIQTAFKKNDPNEAQPKNEKSNFPGGALLDMAKDFLREQKSLLKPFDLKSYDFINLALAVAGFANNYAFEILAEPMKLVIYCPACGRQHIDAPEPENDWTNPPHTSHKCKFCHEIFRLSDYPTTGVAFTESKGKNDTWQQPADGNAVTIPQLYEKARKLDELLYQQENGQGLIVIDFGGFENRRKSTRKVKFLVDGKRLSVIDYTITPVGDRGDARLNLTITSPGFEILNGTIADEKPNDSADAMNFALKGFDWASPKLSDEMQKARRESLQRESKRLLDQQSDGEKVRDQMKAKIAGIDTNAASDYGGAMLESKNNAYCKFCGEPLRMTSHKCPKCGNDERDEIKDKTIKVNFVPNEKGRELLKMAAVKFMKEQGFNNSRTVSDLLVNFFVQEVDNFRPKNITVEAMVNARNNVLPEPCEQCGGKVFAGSVAPVIRPDDTHLFCCPACAESWENKNAVFVDTVPTREPHTSDYLAEERRELDNPEKCDFCRTALDADRIGNDTNNTFCGDLCRHKFEKQKRKCSNCKRFFVGGALVDTVNTFCVVVCQGSFYGGDWK